MEILNHEQQAYYTDIFVRKGVREIQRYVQTGSLSQFRPHNYPKALELIPDELVPNIFQFMPAPIVLASLESLDIERDLSRD